jgi:hypothetical protein
MGIAFEVMSNALLRMPVSYPWVSTAIMKVERKNGMTELAAFEGETSLGGLEQEECDTEAIVSSPVHCCATI